MTEERLPDWLSELPVRSEKIGYAAGELIACEQCGKSNAPSRPTCLYCGAAFTSDALAARVDIRELEGWENGHNIVIVGNGGASVPAASEIAGALRLSEEFVGALLTTNVAVPLVRVESHEIAERTIEILGLKGVRASIISDEQLAPNVPQARLRAIGFQPTEVTLDLFNSTDRVTLAGDEIALIFIGTVLRSRTDTIDKRKRGITKTVGETKTSSDELFIDLYSRRSPVGWRVPSSGFDFSCLGGEKSLLAFENFQRLAAKLRSFAPDARFVDDYNAVRPLLERSWPSESRREGQGYQRTGFARKHLTSTFTTDNSLQVLKYSRLHWHLL
jgi:hypothetical protein